MPKAPNSSNAAKQPAKKAPEKAPAKTAAAKKSASAAATPAQAAKKAASAAPAKNAAAKKAAAPAKAAAKKAPAKASSKTAKVPAGAETRAPDTAAKAASLPLPTDKFLVEQQELLLKERAEYEEAARAHKAEADQLAAEMEPGDTQFDDESGEGDSLSVERERDLALSAQALAAIDEIDRALTKIAAGTYGICERCKQPIMKARLKALPFASLCVACKSGGIRAR